MIKPHRLLVCGLGEADEHDHPPACCDLLPVRQLQPGLTHLHRLVTTWSLRTDRVLTIGSNCSDSAYLAQCQFQHKVKQADLLYQQPHHHPVLSKSESMLRCLQDFTAAGRPNQTQLTCCCICFDNQDFILLICTSVKPTKQAANQRNKIRNL